METSIIGHISCSFGVRDVVFCIRIPALIKCYVQILMRTVLICVLDYGPLDSVVHLIVCIMLLWSSFEVGSCLGGSACSVWILVVFLFFWLVLLYLFFVLACIFVSGGLVGGVCVSLYVSVCLCVCGRFHLNLALTSLSFRFLPLRYAVKGAFCHNVLSRLSVCILGQCVFSMLPMCGRSVWYSMTNGRFFGVVLDLVVCVRKMSACVRFITLLNCLIISLSL